MTETFYTGQLVKNGRTGHILRVVIPGSLWTECVDKDGRHHQIDSGHLHGFHEVYTDR